VAERQFKIRARTPGDADWVRARFVEEWGADFIVVDDERLLADEIPALVAVGKDGERLGFLGWRRRGDTVDILTLLAVQRWRGVGTALLEEVVRFARFEGAKRVQVATTNDNIDALRFYQRRGFHLARLHPDAFESVRREKPDLPADGDYGIRVRDILELERKL
jgi:GNAT superfamily N-acetyltransferase